MYECIHNRWQLLSYLQFLLLKEKNHDANFILEYTFWEHQQFHIYATVTILRDFLSNNVMEVIPSLESSLHKFV